MELCVSHQGLKGYVHRLQTAMDRYRSRLEWLLEGKNISISKINMHLYYILCLIAFVDFHACFGIVTEKKVCSSTLHNLTHMHMLYLYLVWFPFLPVQVLFLLDISNSMTSHIQELKDSLTRLLKHTPPKMKRYSWCHVLELLLVSLPPRSANCCSLCLRTIPLLCLNFPQLQHCYVCFHCHPMAGAAVQCERRALPRGSSVAAVSEGWRMQLPTGGTQGIYSEFLHCSM